MQEVLRVYWGYAFTEETVRGPIQECMQELVAAMGAQTDKISGHVQMQRLVDAVAVAVGSSKSWCEASRPGGTLALQKQCFKALEQAVDFFNAKGEAAPTEKAVSALRVSELCQKALNSLPELSSLPEFRTWTQTVADWAEKLRPLVSEEVVNQKRKKLVEVLRQEKCEDPGLLSTSLSEASGSCQGILLQDDDFADGTVALSEARSWCPARFVAPRPVHPRPMPKDCWTSKDIRRTSKNLVSKCRTIGVIRPQRLESTRPNTANRKYPCPPPPTPPHPAPTPTPTLPPPPPAPPHPHPHRKF